MDENWITKGKLNNIPFIESRVLIHVSDGSVKSTRSFILCVYHIFGEQHSIDADVAA